MTTMARRELILKMAGNGYKAKEIAAQLKIPEAEVQAVINHPAISKIDTRVRFIEPPSFEGM